MLQRLTAFRRYNPFSRRVLLACLGGMLAVGFAFGTAMAEDDEEESLDTKFFKNLLGLNEAPPIEYRERSPLVVPPSRDLPVPENAAVAPAPSWPKDADRQPKKKKAAAKRKDWDEEARPLSPYELDKGRKAGAGLTPTNTVREERGAPLRPDELGYRGGVFGSLFGANKEKGETAVFTGEPPRTTLTAPPSGYMTPSPNQPYGLSAKKEAPKPLSRDQQAERF